MMNKRSQLGLEEIETRRSRLGLMEVEDAVHCVYMGEGLKRCPTCGEDLTFEKQKSVLL